LCLGSVLAKIKPSVELNAFFNISFYYYSGRLSNSRPVKALSSRCSLATIPISEPIAIAVSLISPVIIITVIPAFLHFSIAPLTSLLGGSLNATTPIRIGEASC
jgi:hypothetical protein